LAGTGRRLGRLAVAAVLAVALVIGGGVLLTARGGSPDAGAPTSPAGVPKDALSGTSALPQDSLSRTIDSLQATLRTNPKDASSWAYLGFAYVQQARVTADPSYYPKAEGALRRSLALKPDRNAEALAGLGALANARHDFATAVEQGRKAEAIDPYNANIKAIVGDGLIELGRYQDGFEEFQRMIDTRPDTGTYARVSYARELEGDVAGAIQVMGMALQSAGTPSDTAFAEYYLGELSWNSGKLDQADDAYRRCAAADPSYVPCAQGLAKVAWARGDVQQALTGYQAVVDAYPLPQFVLEYGDLASASGDGALAQQQYQLFHAEVQLFAANGVDTNLEIAQFSADHGVDLAVGLAAARAEWKLRQSVQVADALAWSLHANGLDREALGYSNQALKLGTRSALFFFHRGTIEDALGMTKAARADLSSALSINPWFSPVWAPAAKSALAKVGGEA
jgi:tetratricopeptide (TPR) repeat protein